MRVLKSIGRWDRGGVSEGGKRSKSNKADQISHFRHERRGDPYRYVGGGYGNRGEGKKLLSRVDDTGTKPIGANSRANDAESKKPGGEKGAGGVQLEEKGSWGCKGGNPEVRYSTIRRENWEDHRGGY